MKALLGTLALTLGLTGCMDEIMMGRIDDTSAFNYQSGTVEYCDIEGNCHDITGTYYYDASGSVVYYDPFYACWVGPRGYWMGGIFYAGLPVGYHAHYGHYYHPYHGGGYHGGYHNGGGYHGGGHSGGHHR